MRIDPIVSYNREEAFKCLDALVNFEKDLIFPTLKPLKDYTKDERETLIFHYRKVGHAFFNAGYVDEVIVFLRRVMPYLDIADLLVLAYCFILKGDYKIALKCFRLMAELDGFDSNDERIALACGYATLGLNDDGYIDTTYFKQSMLEIQGLYNPEYFVSDAEEMIVELYKMKIIVIGTDSLERMISGVPGGEAVLYDLIQSIEVEELSFSHGCFKSISRAPICFW